ncbi:hypothetical protein EVA_17493 [gut metagenome]|uniref:Uncharacterized protein n=1 Tax=gut metagenome TaxID=749906 RepID=J9FIZ1_9ZZZZ
MQKNAGNRPDKEAGYFSFLLWVLRQFREKTDYYRRTDQSDREKEIKAGIKRE